MFLFDQYNLDFKGISIGQISFQASFAMKCKFMEHVDGELLSRFHRACSIGEPCGYARSAGRNRQHPSSSAIIAARRLLDD